MLLYSINPFRTDHPYDEAIFIFQRSSHKGMGVVGQSMFLLFCTKILSQRLVGPLTPKFDMHGDMAIS